MNVKPHPARLHDVAFVRVSTVDKHTKEGELPVRLCNYTDVYKNEVIRDEFDFMTATCTPDEASRFRLAPGDVLFTKDSETADDIGIPAFMESSAPDLICGYHIAMASPDRRLVDPKFLFWLLSGRPARAWWETRASGVTRVGLRQDDIRHLPLGVLPTTDQQRAIADFLDRETAQIDAMIEAQEAVVAALQARRMAVVVEAVHLQAGEESLPRHWTRMPFKAAVEARFTGEWGAEPGTDEVDIGCVRVADFDRTTRQAGASIPTIRSLDRDKAMRKGLRRGDLLLERSGGTARNPVGNVVLYVGPDGSVSSNFIECIRLNRHHDPTFWCYLHEAAYSTGFTHQHVRQTTGIQNLETTGFYAEHFSVPGLEEQRDIARELDQQTGLLDKAVTAAIEVIALLRERREALITSAVTGRIDPETGIERLDKTTSKEAS